MHRTPLNYKDLIVVITTFIVVYFSFDILKRCEKEKELGRNLSYNDSLIVLNDTIVKKETLTQDNKDLIYLSEKEENKRLKKLIEKYKKELKNKGSITNFRTQSNIKISTKTDTIYKENNSLIYKTNINLDKWVKGDIKMSDSITTLNLQIKNEYSVIIGEENQGFLKPKKLYTKIINHNPYSETKEVVSYSVTDKRRKNNFSVGPFIGVGLTEEFRPKPVIGVGIQYNLLRL